ncbi:MAG TPA: Holliday junction branch migration protein RuvA [Anaerolineae bacterium]|nr:Holliday junction branch migration protein RuvA [Anaerolineae bacterium]HIQ05131.1 Holliday junction branch migration protein RuvA [Anaerolineae bacterium]
MIARLEGRVIAQGKDHLVVDVGGIGFRVYVPAPLLAEARLSEPIGLFTHLHVREQEMTLYGLGSQEDLDLFKLLLSVNGVGPRAALAMVSALSSDTLRRAIGRGEEALLSRVPGIGPKTARKIIFQLKDKVQASGVEEGLAALTEADAQVIDALTTLGYSIVEAQRAVQSLPRDVTDVEERLRMALAQFAS